VNTIMTKLYHPQPQNATIRAAAQCLYCSELADGHTTPPLCPRHTDLAILTEFMETQGEDLTLPNVKERLQQAQNVSAIWSITPSDLDDMLPDYLTRRQEVTS
jgi:hypothetical protein